MSTSKAIEPFTLAIAESDLDELRAKLAQTRWPEAETVNDWSQGAPLADVQELCAYWLEQYDWRRCENMLNGFGQFTTEIDGLKIYFLHIRSKHENALPMIMTHGWPGSVIEFHKVIGPLTDPISHGGKAEDAFHLVIPALPGYGFSEKPKQTGWDIEHIAQAWQELMGRLGYSRYVAQGGDWGSAVTLAIARAAPPECIAAHLNMVLARPSPEDLNNPTEQENLALAARKRHATQGTGYSSQQSTKPQTLGYGLVDSPAGQAAWIFEKFREWTDCGGNPRNALTYDEILDNIMLYWLPGAAASAARLYWESLASSLRSAPVHIKLACSVFPYEISRPSRRWAERDMTNIIYWNEPEKGGHFAAFEQPDIFVDEIRNGFRSVR